MLSPAEGNDLIQSSNAIKVSFSLGRSDCEFFSHYIKRSVVSPYYGHIITYPEAIAILDRRRDNHYEIDHVDAPLFVNAKITIKTSALEEKDYDLKVFDISENGVGIVLGEELPEKLEELDLGKKFEEIELLAAWTTIKVSGMVKHIFRIQKGK
jgi:hypothetical protein